MSVNSKDNFVYPEKEKSTAVILAVILGYWTWLYTYRIDKFKFWICLILSIVTVGIFWIPAWIWAIIETVNRPKTFFDNFSHFHIDANTPIKIENDNPVKNYKLNILLAEIVKRKRYVVILSNRIFIYIKKIFIIFIYSIVSIFIVLFFEFGGLFRSSYTHDYLPGNNVGNRWHLNDFGDNIVLGFVLLASVMALLIIFKLKVKRPKFIEKRIKTNQDLYDVCLKDLKEEFPDVISDFGGMESFEKYFK